MTPAVPHRIFAFLARMAPIVAVLRRGPSRQVALLEWNLDTDAVTLGQWLKGRIYNPRCDLSPDGRHLIYAAMDRRWQGPLRGSWTAVSRVPCLRALHLYAWGQCWNGGGLFLNDKRYWLNGDGQSGHHAKSSLRAADPQPPGGAPEAPAEPRLVAGLTAMSFAALPAPYAGAQTVPARPHR